MTPEQKAAFVIAQAACMNAELEAMKAANIDRLERGYSTAYGEDEFLSIPAKYGLEHNTVVAFFQE